jgi:hypothetical protein
MLDSDKDILPIMLARVESQLITDVIKHFYETTKPLPLAATELKNGRD